MVVKESMAFIAPKSAGERNRPMRNWKRYAARFALIIAAKRIALFRRSPRLGSTIPSKPPWNDRGPRLQTAISMFALSRDHLDGHRFFPMFSRQGAALRSTG